MQYGVSNSLPRRLLRQNTTSTMASNSGGFKYAEAHEISSATLRRGCLQPQQTLLPPHHYANFANLSSRADYQDDITIPDVIQTEPSDTEEAEKNNEGHVIVNQLLTFLSEKQQQQLIDLSEANTASTTSTLRLTEP